MEIWTKIIDSQFDEYQHIEEHIRLEMKMMDVGDVNYQENFKEFRALLEQFEESRAKIVTNNPWYKRFKDRAQPAPTADGSTTCNVAFLAEK